MRINKYFFFASFRCVFLSYTYSETEKCLFKENTVFCWEFRNQIQLHSQHFLTHFVPDFPATTTCEPQCLQQAAPLQTQHALAAVRVVHEPVPGGGGVLLPAHVPGSARRLGDPAQGCWTPAQEGPPRGGDSAENPGSFPGFCRGRRYDARQRVSGKQQQQQQQQQVSGYVQVDLKLF